MITKKQLKKKKQIADYKNKRNIARNKKRIQRIEVPKYDKKGNNIGMKTERIKIPRIILKAGDGILPKSKKVMKSPKDNKK